MKEKRTKERRRLHSRVLFPFLDRTGKLVFEDRCKIVDRRMNSIKVEITPASWLRHAKNPNGIFIKPS